MIIDIHSHIWGADYEYYKRENLKMLEKYGVDKIYISPLSEHYPDKETVRNMNAEAARFIKENRSEIGGFVYVSPEHDNAAEVVSRGIENMGFAGIKLWVSELCDSECVYPVMEKAEKYNVPVLIHTFKKAQGQLRKESTAKNVANVARRFPNVKIIMAHLGGNCYDGIPQIADLKNVWVDISGTLHHSNELNYTKRYIGASRILFGTDLTSFSICYGQVAEADLTEDERNDILGNNAVYVLDRGIGVGDLK